MNATKQNAGRLGGLATVRKHGAEHMAAIGRRGALATWTKYRLTPAGLTGWAMVNRQTGRVARTWNTREVTE